MELSAADLCLSQAQCLKKGVRQLLGKDKHQKEWEWGRVNIQSLDFAKSLKYRRCPSIVFFKSEC